MTVFAASSLTESLSAAADAYAAEGNARPVVVFAASSVLARQIAAGAPAGLFISADEAWMDDLAHRGLVAAGSRVDLLSNELVLAVPQSHPSKADLLQPDRFLKSIGSGRIAIADPASVPAGRYARAALQTLELWDKLSPRLVYGDSVRSALLYAETGAVRAAIVYKTDAQASKKVVIAAHFPPESHPPVRYPAAIMAGHDGKEGKAFLKFLASPKALEIFRRFGFSTVSR